jgi:16S rRNA (uracil1498-N3)-methyltransferase
VAAEPRSPDSPFWVEPDAVEGETLRLDPDESRHLLRVFRAVPGAPFDAVDGRGHIYQCILLSSDRESAVGRVVARREGAGELPAPLWVIAGMPAPVAAEELAGRAVSLGATHLRFFPAQHGERWRPTPARVARFNRLARAALKQSRRSRLPCIQFPGSLPEAIATAPEGARYLAIPDGGSWSECASPGVLQGVVLGIGPPGGLADPERALFVAAGFQTISLGPNRLKTQDAALALLALARERILAAGAGRH